MVPNLTGTRDQLMSSPRTSSSKPRVWTRMGWPGNRTRSGPRPAEPVSTFSALVSPPLMHLSHLNTLVHSRSRLFVLKKNRQSPSSPRGSASSMTLMSLRRTRQRRAPQFFAARRRRPTRCSRFRPRRFPRSAAARPAATAPGRPRAPRAAREALALARSSRRSRPGRCSCPRIVLPGCAPRLSRLRVGLREEVAAAGDDAGRPGRAVGGLRARR